MSPAFDHLQKTLKKLPGLGYRSAERIALHLTLEKPQFVQELIDALQQASQNVKACSICGNLTEEAQCAICTSEHRDHETICVIDHVPDLYAIDRASVYKGAFHVLHGKLSPIQGVGPEDLNLESLAQRLASGEVKEVILALSNDLEGEATCHYIQNTIIKKAASSIKLTRIGFGLPSGGGVIYADAPTLKNAFEGRRFFSGVAI